MVVSRRIRIPIPFTNKSFYVLASVSIAKNSYDLTHVQIRKIKCLIKQVRKDALQRARRLRSYEDPEPRQPYYKIAAIRLIRENFSFDLRTAKEIVEMFSPDGYNCEIPLSEI